MKKSKRKTRRRRIEEESDLEEDEEEEEDPENLRFLSDIWLFDTYTHVWYKLPDNIPITSFKKKTKHMTNFIPRVGHSSIEIDGSIYLFGGMTYNQKLISSDLYILSLEGLSVLPEYVMKSRQPLTGPSGSKLSDIGPQS